MKKTLTSAAILAMIAGAATAQIESTVDLATTFGGPIPSNAGTGISATPQVTHTFANSFTLGDIGWDGFTDVLATGTWGQELNVNVFLNGAPFGFAQLGSGAAGYPSGTNWTGTNTGFYSGMAVNAGDVFGFSFLESYDDGGDDLADAEWSSISFDFFEFVPPTAPAATDLGSVVAGDMATGTLAAGEVAWFTFDTGDIAAGMNALDIFTGGSGIADTEIGLYDSAGNGIAIDDDGFGSTLQSLLTFGNGAGTLAGDPSGDEGDGRDGDLAAGTYYLAVGAFNTTFGATGWDVTSVSTTEGDYKVTFIPAPGAVALLGLAGLAGTRRRRA